jgi:putative membrane protein
MITAFILGIASGVIAGLTPGIHINLIASLMLAGSGLLLDYFSTTELAVFVVSMGVTHAFVELVPAIFLGAPDDTTALIMLPGHKMLHQGLGYDAVKFGVMGALGCLLSTLAMFPLILWLFPLLSNSLRPILGWLLLALATILILKEGKNWWKALLVFSATGILGLIVLRELELSQPLLPMLSGLFGASSLLLAIFNKTQIPAQIRGYARLKKSEGMLGIIGGLIGGVFVTLFPGLGPGHAGSLATSVFRSTGQTYLVLVGGLHASDFAASLATLVAIDKARNGALAVLDQITKITTQDLWLLAVTALIAGIIASIITLFSAKIFSELVEKVNYPLLSKIILIFIASLVLAISKWQGLIIFFASTLIGLIAPKLGTSRAHAMGCLLVPTLLYYLQ